MTPQISITHLEGMTTVTTEQVALLKLGISPINDEEVLLIESALTWTQDNTTLEFDVNNDAELEALPANVRLFVMRYIDIMSSPVGVTSESISGLSQSFNTSSTKTDLLWQYAQELLDKWLIGNVKFVEAGRRWA